jgi:hypothetical protein
VFNKNLKGKIESSIGYNWHKGTWPWTEMKQTEMYDSYQGCPLNKTGDVIRHRVWKMVSFKLWCTDSIEYISSSKTLALHAPVKYPQIMACLYRVLLFFLLLYSMALTKFLPTAIIIY